MTAARRVLRGSSGVASPSHVRARRQGLLIEHNLDLRAVLAEPAAAAAA
ncbi:MAG TPA: hypothetical protein VNK94_01615 [Gaiellaceae bacterium]|nr:hypothetical protein [Gaiellaceae bacterium]